MIRHALAVGLVAPLLAFIAFPAAAEEMVSVLTLDALSYISFQDEQVLVLESGSTIRFHFADPNPDGSVPFTISPADITIPTVAIPGTSKTLDYGLASPASGTLVTTGTGGRIEFHANVSATLNGPSGSGSFSYGIPFSTESASAVNATGTEAVQVAGLRAVEGVWYVQLVGATVNRTNAFPKPGTAVYTVLSGMFDQLP
jgi:hypothetical protein